MSAIIQGVVDWLSRTYVDPLVRMLKVKAAVFFLEGVKGARRVLILLCLLVFVITLIGAGFVLIPLSLLLFAPWEPQTKAIVGIAVGAAYLLVPLAAMLLVLTEKRWMAITGAQDFVKNLLE